MDSDVEGFEDGDPDARPALAEECTPEGGGTELEGPADGLLEVESLGVGVDDAGPFGAAGCCQFALPALVEDRSCSFEPVSSAPSPQISNTTTTTVAAMATARLRQYTEGDSCLGGSAMSGR